MARKKRRYPAPTGEIQGGGRSQTGTNLDEEDLAVLGYFQEGQRQQQDPRLDMAMKLFGLMQGQEETAADRAFKERQQQAQELYRQQGRELEERRLTAEEKRAAEEAIAEDVKEGTRQRELGEERAHRTERETREDTEKTQARIAAEKKQKVSDLDTMVERGIITKEQAIPYYDKLNPEYAEMAKGIKAQADEEAFTKNLAAYQALPPKARAKALPDVYGGPEAFKRIKEATDLQEAAKAPQPDLAPKVGNAPISAVGQGVAWQHQIPQAFPAPAQTIPAVAGMTEPTFAYEEGYPSAQPNYNVQPPAPSFIDSVMAKLEDARQRQAMEPKRKWYPDLGTAALPSGQLPPELLAQPTSRPLGY